MAQVRRRIADKRVLALIKTFCKAGILTQDGAMKDTITGTPQGGIRSPLLANLALSILDEHCTAAWEGFGPPWTRKQRTRKGLGTWRLVRYADDFVVLVKGTRAHAQALCEQAAAVLAPIGLGLSAAKTRITHLDEGFDFLGFRIQRRRQPGTNQRYVDTYRRRRPLRPSSPRCGP
jgi:RNA-directed DNA polymerase